jgi:hypothetical protein
MTKQRERRKQRRKKLLRIRLAPEYFDRFDRIAEAFMGRLPRGGYVTRIDAARAVINVGLDTMERELGLPAVTSAPEQKANDN